MAKYSNDDLDKIHKRSIVNYSRIMKTHDCGCFYCLEHFLPIEAEYWNDRTGKTAVCPRCHIDSVVGSDTRVDDELLIALNKRYFGPRFRKPHDKIV